MVESSVSRLVKRSATRTVGDVIFISLAMLTCRLSSDTKIGLSQQTAGLELERTLGIKCKERY